MEKRDLDIITNSAGTKMLCEHCTTDYFSRLYIFKIYFLLCVIFLLAAILHSFIVEDIIFMGCKML